MRGALARVLVIACAFAAAYSVYGLFRHWHFDSGAFDLGIFDQVVWHLSRFEVPASTVRGYSNILGDHFSPVLALLAPLYWIAPRPETLIVAQGILLALSIVPVFVYARRRLPVGPACGLAIAYGLFWGMQRTATFDFHEVAFAPIVIAIAILALDAKRWPLFWAMAALLMVVKEDLIPLVGGFGLLLLLRRHIRQGLLAIVISCVAFTVIVWFVIPAMAGSGQFGYTGAYAETMQDPWRIPILFFTPALKVRTILSLFAPFLFLPLLSPLSILIVPMAAERFLASSPNLWGTAFHYWAPAAPVLAMGAADGLARVVAWLRTRRLDSRAEVTMRACAAVCVVLSAILPGHQPLLRLARPSTYRDAAVQQTGELVVALVPAGASVVAQGPILPHLSTRDQIFLLEQKQTDAEYFIATERLDPWPLGSLDELRTEIDAHRRRGYQPVFERDGWVVLHRPK